MLHTIKRARWAAALMSVITMVALAGNAMAAAFCPHMSGRQCCLRSVATQPGEPADMRHNHNHSHDADMSEMDMSDDALEMSGAQTDDTALRLGAKVSFSNTSNGVSEEENSEAIRQPNDPCSHCMIHSQTNLNYSLRPAIENSASDQIIAADVRIELSIPGAAAPGFIEVHDHGPPGSLAPLYVLVSSFRI